MVIENCTEEYDFYGRTEKILLGWFEFCFNDELV